MLEMELNEHSAEDMREIQKLRMMGVPEDVIQMGYDNTQKSRAGDLNTSRNSVAGVDRSEQVDMTEHEAVKELKELPISFANHNGMVAKTMGIKALEKQIAKKPIVSKSVVIPKKEFLVCPICERIVLYDGIAFEFCSYCGQKIDWTE